jgi:hypothetical protein
LAPPAPTRSPGEQATAAARSPSIIAGTADARAPIAKAGRCPARPITDQPAGQNVQTGMPQVVVAARILPSAHRRTRPRGMDAAASNV